MSRLIFTKNFHQQVRGKLLPGNKCTIVYDPLRIISMNKNYLHGDPNLPITAHIRFAGNEEQLDLLLHSEIGVTNAPVVREDGLGSMIVANFDIPTGIKEMSVWFSLSDRSGLTKYDSNYGQNYHYRFPLNDIKIVKASISSDPKKPQTELDFQIQADTEITTVKINFRQMNKEKITGNLSLSPKNKGKSNLWTSGIVKVPFGAVIAYEVAYYIGNKEFKVNNNGDFFIMGVK